MKFFSGKLGSVVEEGRQISSATLRAEAAKAARALRSLGCGEGSCVALVQANSASFFVNLFAAWDLGACVVPVSINSTEREINFILDHSGASHVYRQGSFHRLEPAVSGPPRNSALLMYTSGSTGAPKGVLLDWPALESKIRTIATVLTDQALERTLCVLPVSFGHGLIGNSLPALYLGCDLLIEPAFSTEMAQCFGEFLDARGITFFSSVPSLWSSVLPFAAPPISKKIRSAFCASADLSVANWKSVKNWLGSQVDFRNVYGITEAGSWISALPAGVEYREPGLVGSGWNCEFRIDPANQEILVKAPYVMRGYHSDPIATEAAFSGDFLRTGDLGRLDPELGLQLLGRSKDQINRGGLKISPVEVEERLRAYPGVMDCCVFALPDPIAGQVVAAALVFSGKHPGSRELKDFCRETLSEFKIPEKFYFVREIPRSSRGKVNRSEIFGLLKKEPG